MLPQTAPVPYHTSSGNYTLNNLELTATFKSNFKQFACNLKPSTEFGI